MFVSKVPCLRRITLCSVAYIRVVTQHPIDSILTSKHNVFFQYSRPATSTMMRMRFEIVEGAHVVAVPEGRVACAARERSAGGARRGEGAGSPK